MIGVVNVEKCIRRSAACCASRPAGMISRHSPSDSRNFPKSTLINRADSQPASRASRHLEQAVADDAELRRLLAEVQARELDPLTAVREILEKVFRINDGDGDRTRAS